MQIDGAAAVVTGGASGLGEATVRRLAAAGAAVTIVDRDGQRAESLAKELGGKTGFAVADVTDEGQVQAAVEQAAAADPLRIGVNCAGVGWGVCRRAASEGGMGAGEETEGKGGAVTAG